MALAFVLQVPRLVRDDPVTWSGRFSEEESCTDVGNTRGGFDWRSRELGKEVLFLDLLPRNENVRLVNASAAIPAAACCYCPGCFVRASNPRLCSNLRHNP